MRRGRRARFGARAVKTIAIVAIAIDAVARAVASADDVDAEHDAVRGSRRNSRRNGADERRGGMRDFEPRLAVVGVLAAVERGLHHPHAGL